MLTLTIKKKWFDMILSGEKKEEYREIKPYYDARLPKEFGFFKEGNTLVKGNVFPKVDLSVVPVRFRNGYSKNSREIVAYCNLTIGYGKPEWGGDPGKLYYVLEIKKIEEIVL
jgi:hypothetical protein